MANESCVFTHTPGASQRQQSLTIAQDQDGRRDFSMSSNQLGKRQAREARAIWRPRVARRWHSEAIVDPRMRTAKRAHR